MLSLPPAGLPLVRIHVVSSSTLKHWCSLCCLCIKGLRQSSPSAAVCNEWAPLFYSSLLFNSTDETKALMGGFTLKGKRLLVTTLPLQLWTRLSCHQKQPNKWDLNWKMVVIRCQFIMRSPSSATCRAQWQLDWKPMGRPNFVTGPLP